MEWQPIETAPKDGRYLLMIKRGFIPAVAKWDAGSCSFEYMEEDDFHSQEAWDEYLENCEKWEPTHWMPLPKPPK